MAPNGLRLPIRSVLRRSWDIWRSSWALFVAIAAIVQAPLVAAAAVTAHVTDANLNWRQSWQFGVAALGLLFW